MIWMLENKVWEMCVYACDSNGNNCCEDWKWGESTREMLLSGYNLAFICNQQVSLADDCVAVL